MVSFPLCSLPCDFGMNMVKTWTVMMLIAMAFIKIMNRLLELRSYVVCNRKGDCLNWVDMNAKTRVVIGFV